MIITEDGIKFRFQDWVHWGSLYGTFNCLSEATKDAIHRTLDKLNDTLWMYKMMEIIVEPCKITFKPVFVIKVSLRAIEREFNVGWMLNPYTESTKNIDYLPEMVDRAIKFLSEHSYESEYTHLKEGDEEE